MKIKRATGVAATILAVALLGGCTGGATPPAGQASGSGAANTPVELKVWTLTETDSAEKAKNDLIKQFETANPGVTITVTERATDEHKDALRQALGTPSFPDIYWYWEGPGLGGELVGQGASLDLTKYYDQYKWTDRFNATVMANITQYGGYNGVPWTIQAQGMYYNKKLFAQAGITDVPTTYDQLIADNDKLVAAGIVPFSTGGSVNWYVMRLLDSILETKCGASLHDQLDTTKASWANQDCVNQSFAELKTWGDKYFNKGYMALDDTQANQLFYTGKAAMALQGTWFNTDITDNKMDPSNVGIFVFPTGTDRLYGFGEGYYISKTTPNADIAAKFLDFITNDANQKTVAGVWGAISVNENVQPSTDNPLNALWPPIFGAAKGMYLNNDQNLSLDNTTEYWRIQNSVLTGDIAPADAGAQMQKFIDSNQ